MFLGIEYEFNMNKLWHKNLFHHYKLERDKKEEFFIANFLPVSFVVDANHCSFMKRNLFQENLNKM